MDENLTLDQMLEMARNLTEQIEAAKKREELSGDDLLRAILDKLTDIERQIAAQRIWLPVYNPYPIWFVPPYQYQPIHWDVGGGHTTCGDTTHSLTNGFSTVISQ